MSTPSTAPDDPTVTVVHRADLPEAGDVMVTALDVDGQRHVAVELPDEPLTRADAVDVASLILQAATAA